MLMSAKDLIGEAKDEDKLRLDVIRSAIDPGAAELHDILEDTRISGYFEMRAEASADAERAQSTFARMSLIAIIGAAMATLASALLLYGAGAGGEDAAAAAADAAAAVGAKDVAVAQALAEFVHKHRFFIIGVQVIGAFLAAFATYRLSAEDFVKKWTDNRRRAEELRRQIFTEMFNKVAAHEDAGKPPDENGALSQVFEFFRRFQVDLQMRFYQKAALRSERSSSRLSWTAAGLAGLTGITGIIAGLGGAALVIAAFLGIALPVMLSAAQSWRALNLFGDKTKAYGKARDELQTLALDVSNIRALAANGDKAKVREFVDKVHEVMANENTNWVAAAPEGTR